MSDFVRVNLGALEAYLDRKAERGMPANELLAAAFNALLEAGVVEVVGNEGAFPPGGVFEMDESFHVTLRWGPPPAREMTWAAGRLPPWHGLIEQLAYYLATMMNEKPVERPWPQS